jgi:hypothetical protein
MSNPVLLPPSIDEVPPPGISIVEELDKRLMVQLRDGRKVIGILRSFDQFANLILESKIRLVLNSRPRTSML